MTDWSKHVHRFAKKHNMSYKQANRSRKCKETYKKRKTSPRRKMSPRRRRTSPRRKRRMNHFSNLSETERKLRIKLDKKRNEEVYQKDKTTEELREEGFPFWPTYADWYPLYYE